MKKINKQKITDKAVKEFLQNRIQHLKELLETNLPEGIKQSCENKIKIFQEELDKLNRTTNGDNERWIDLAFGEKDVIFR